MCIRDRRQTPCVEYIYPAPVAGSRQTARGALPGRSRAQGEGGRRRCKRQGKQSRNPAPIANPYN
eukprot:4806581-Alexandrium_andersonii.AAC.1